MIREDADELIGKISEAHAPFHHCKMDERTVHSLNFVVDQVLFDAFMSGKISMMAQCSHEQDAGDPHRLVCCLPVWLERELRTAL